ncbi:MAG: hypothetical protein M9896_09260 [Candidatus Promineofilum sp.]|uniref:hypothetical protein n=1 Tax=Promineifilum sp. TaxID=2664178 RepID=UPI002411E3ED|nr:hypothetical protein [Promineifilum sp.]
MGHQKRNLVLLLFISLVLFMALIANATIAMRNRQGEPPLLTNPIPEPPEVFSVDPDPTTVPLPKSLTEAEALTLALELDLNTVSRVDSLSDEALAASATVTLYENRVEADKSLGLQTWYASEIEVDAGEVWVITFPGAVKMATGPGTQLGQDTRTYDGISYKFSSRTGQLLGVTTGPPVTAGE